MLNASKIVSEVRFILGGLLFLWLILILPKPLGRDLGPGRINSLASHHLHKHGVCHFPFVAEHWLSIALLIVYGLLLGSQQGGVGAKTRETEEFLYGGTGSGCPLVGHLEPGRRQQGDAFSFITAVHAKIILINRYDHMPGMQLTHANQAKISQVGPAVCVALSQFL